MLMINGIITGNTTDIMDIHNNGIIDVTDVIRLINVILGGDIDE